MRVHPAYARRHAVARHRAAYGADAPSSQNQTDLAKAVAELQSPEAQKQLQQQMRDATIVYAPKKSPTTETAPPDVKVDENLRKAAVVGVAGIAAVAALAGVGVFVINPWIVKAFKPEWSYGRRLAASFGVTFIAGTLTSIARGLGGVQDTPPAPATK